MFCPKVQYLVRMSRRVKGIVKEQRRMSEMARLAIRTLLVVHIA